MTIGAGDQHPTEHINSRLSAEVALQAIYIDLHNSIVFSDENGKRNVISIATVFNKPNMRVLVWEVDGIKAVVELPTDNSPLHDAAYYLELVKAFERNEVEEQQ